MRPGCCTTGGGQRPAATLDPLPVRLPPVCDPYDQHYQCILLNLEHDPVVPDPDPPQAPQFPFQDAARQGFFSKAVDGMHDPDTVAFGDPRQLRDRAPLNPNRVTHAESRASRERGRRDREAAPG